MMRQTDSASAKKKAEKENDQQPMRLNKRTKSANLLAEAPARMHNHYNVIFINIKAYVPGLTTAMQRDTQRDPCSSRTPFHAYPEQVHNSTA